MYTRIPLKFVKQLHFTTTHDHNSTDKIYINGELILPPSLHQYSVLREERSRNMDVISLGIKLGTSWTKGHVLTNCAFFCSYLIWAYGWNCYPL